MFSTRLAVVADAGDEEDHAGLSVGPRDVAHRGHDVGMFAFDAGGDLGELLTIERLAGERVELAPQARAEAVAGQAREIDGLDHGAVARFDVLRARRLPWRAENEDEEEQRGSP